MKHLLLFCGLGKIKSFPSGALGTIGRIQKINKYRDKSCEKYLKRQEAREKLSIRRVIRNKVVRESLLEEMLYQNISSRRLMKMNQLYEQNITGR